MLANTVNVKNDWVSNNGLLVKPSMERFFKGYH